MRTYGNLELTIASPPQSFTEKLALYDVKTFLSISQDEVDSDDMLLGFIAAAREVAEIMQGRDLIPKQYDLTLDGYPDSDMELQTPLISVDLVKYRDSDGEYTTMVEGTDYDVDLVRGLVSLPYGASWPSFTAWPTSSVVVRFTSGYASDHSFWSNAGQRILVGMKLLIATWHEGRVPFAVGMSQEYPYAVTSLLSFGANRRAW